MKKYCTVLRKFIVGQNLFGDQNSNQSIQNCINIVSGKIKMKKRLLISFWPMACSLSAAHRSKTAHSSSSARAWRKAQRGPVGLALFFAFFFISITVPAQTAQENTLASSPRAQAATWVWAGKVARSARPPGPEAGPVNQRR
jgi:hypothetical protein